MHTKDMTTTQTPEALPTWMLDLADVEIDKNDPELIADTRRVNRMEAKVS